MIPAISDLLTEVLYSYISAQLVRKISGGKEDVPLAGPPKASLPTRRTTRRTLHLPHLPHRGQRDAVHLFPQSFDRSTSGCAGTSGPNRGAHSRTRRSERSRAPCLADGRDLQQSAPHCPQARLKSRVSARPESTQNIGDRPSKDAQTITTGPSEGRWSVAESRVPMVARKPVI